MELGEILANPYIIGILLVVIVLPAFWMLFKILGWVRSYLLNHFIHKKEEYADS